ncbi:MAG: Tex family protein [Chitinophagales bacterium]
MIKSVSEALQLPAHRVKNVIDLLQNGATIPFIARYRKEATGNLDEQQIEQIQKELKKHEDLTKRKEYIRSVIEEQGKLSEALRKQIDQCTDFQELEDLYLPYKSKRKTKAEAARLLGLEPLANFIALQKDSNLKEEAKLYLSKDVKNISEALEGARHILAERINENIQVRNTIRKIAKESTLISSKIKKNQEDKASTYQDYFNYSSELGKTPSHRILAILRAEAEGFLKVDFLFNEEKILKSLNAYLLKGYNDSSYQMKLAIEDAYKRLLYPSISNEIRKQAKQEADKEAIAVFAENLRQLLLEAPLGQKRIMGIDPGFRTGCKVVCLDEQGNFLAYKNIFPHQPQLQQKEAMSILQEMTGKYKIETVAIGNGTAGRETEYFVKSALDAFNIDIFLISEAGASVYSASEIAREEFPQLDLTVRGAISIGRRLQDPLAELVKIDPKAIGVGQYQHDVDQDELKDSLETTVISAVNKVGVQLNTASFHLLKFVSGIGPKLAENIIAYRKEHGTFRSRKELIKVKGLGEKAFEQCAGFLRIAGAKNLLDNTAVHPERYALVEKMAKKLGLDIEGLIKDENVRKQVVLSDFIDEQTGIQSLKDIMSELEKPGLDPRGKAITFQFAPIQSMSDLKEGMLVPGIINNIAQFGAFVNIGIKENGLIHISQVSDNFVDDINKVLKVNQKVEAKVIGLDFDRKRIQLSLK